MLYGWTGQTIERGRDHCERPRPAGLEKFDTKTSRGPQHFTGPPRNETDITQNKKIRQCVFAVPPEKDLEHFRKEPSSTKIIDARTCLRSEEAVIYSPTFTSPLLVLGISNTASVGKAGNPNWEVALDGPGSADHHLADHVRKHVFFRGEDMVVASGGLRLGRRHRSSLHDQLHPDGHRICGCTGSLGVSRLEFPRSRFVIF